MVRKHRLKNFRHIIYLDKTTSVDSEQISRIVYSKVIHTINKPIYKKKNILKTTVQNVSDVIPSYSQRQVIAKQS